MNLKPRAVGLDLGSNTFSCVQLTMDEAGLPVVTKDTSRPVRLSKNLTPGGLLDKVALFRALDTLESLYTEFEMDKHPVRAVGTQALRMTSTPEDLTVQAKKILGVEVEILSGEDEALLASRGAVLGLPPEASWTVVDIGGQSTEICWKEQNSDWHPVSIPTGVVALTERFLQSDPPSTGQMEALTDHVSRLVSQAFDQYLAGKLVGVAGTATTLALMELGLKRWDGKTVHGSVVKLERLDHWLRVVSEISTDERTTRFGLSSARADIFPAGLLILKAILQHLGEDNIMVSANGLRVGAAISVLHKE